MIRLRIESFEDGPRSRYKAAKVLAPLLGEPIAAVNALLGDLPLTLPVAFSPAEGARISSELRQAGANLKTLDVPAGKLPQCAFHASLIASAPCPGCAKEMCVLCTGSGGGLCRDCVAKKGRRTRNQRIRLGLLLAALGLVLLFAWKELRRRNTDWDTQQRIAVVIVDEDGRGLDPDLIERFRVRAREVESALGSEARRYGLNSNPLAIEVLGPVARTEAVPTLTEPGLLSLLKFNLALRDFAEHHDEAVGVEGSAFHSRIYLRCRPSDGILEMAEGLSQKHGEIGLVNVEISDEGIDFAWFVVMHEYFHTRGASDKYGPEGRSLVPQGLGDPERSPLYPQELIEVMARGRPLSEEVEGIPGPPSTWTVGKWTAHEIGWLKALPNVAQ